jgi:transcriptional regulator with XRE-family HTH domain
VRSPYKPEEMKAAMALKRFTIIALAKEMSISRRTLDYFLNGEMGMSRGEELLQKLQPELAEIGKLTKKIKRRKLQHCEES